jgi:hypothetical protein
LHRGAEFLGGSRILRSMRMGAVSFRERDSI